MSYEKQTWETGDVITAVKLNHMEDGIEAVGSGVTVFPITWDEGGDYSYVEVEEAELLEAMKSGVVIFRDVYEDNGVFTGAMDYYIVTAGNNIATSIYVDNSTVKIKNWTYSNGRYNS